MDLITVVVVLAILGFITWLVVTYIPMPPPFKQVIVVLVVILLAVWLLRLVLAGGPVLTIR